jgi:hypothetical protein
MCIATVFGRDYLSTHDRSSRDVRQASHPISAFVDALDCRRGTGRVLQLVTYRAAATAGLHLSHSVARRAANVAGSRGDNGERKCHGHGHRGGTRSAVRHLDIRRRQLRSTHSYRADNCERPRSRRRCVRAGAGRAELSLRRNVAQYSERERARRGEVRDFKWERAVGLQRNSLRSGSDRTVTAIIDWDPGSCRSGRSHPEDAHGSPRHQHAVPL